MHLRSPIVLVALMVAACGSGDPAPEPPIPSSTTTSTTPTTTTTPSTPDPEPISVGWEDGDPRVDLGSGWTAGPCEGDAPQLCIELEGRPVGLVEAASYPVDTFEDASLDDPAGALETFAATFVRSFEEDRAAGCGSGYVFEPLPTEPMELGGQPGVAFGFRGTLENGEASELNHQYATIVGDSFLSITAIAYDEGGCPGRDELSGFSTETLERFKPFLDRILTGSELPDI